MTKKNKGSFRNSNFGLLGFLAFSFLYWVTDQNFAHAFGIISLTLLCLILYKIERASSVSKNLINTMDIIYMIAGAILSSLMGGFPFNLIH
ncbi:MAG: hypothetical protein EBZ47_08000 [Chlamydiae bacterium]|nr:hypothetical protein [Chlamydiota bacterium]